MKRLSFSQHGMLVDLRVKKPHDYSYPNRYNWITGTIRALVRKGMITSEFKPKLTAKGKEYLDKYCPRLPTYPAGKKHPIATNTNSNRLYPLNGLNGVSG
jgi:hypothetical protein